MPEKEADGNKGTFGKILAVAGSSGMCGAAFLSASGVFATGAGMVKIVTPEENRIPLQTIRAPVTGERILSGVTYW